jgi:hypothetical protein
MARVQHQSAMFRCGAQESRTGGVEIAPIPYKRNADSLPFVTRAGLNRLGAAGLAA